MKKLMLFAAIISVLATGCASSAVTGSANNEQGAAAQPDSRPADANSSDAIAYNTEIAWESSIQTEPQELTSPPDLRIETITEMTASVAVMTKSTYEWTVDNGDGTADTTITDSLMPLELAAEGYVSAAFDPAQLIKLPKILLTNGAEIKNVLCWGEDNSTQPVDFTADGVLTLPESPIGSVYSVNVVFPQGSCTYVFMTAKQPVFNGDSENESGSTPSYAPDAGNSTDYPPDHAVSEPYIGQLAPIESSIAYDTSELTNYPCNIYRTDGYVEGRIFPTAVTISSLEELKLYFNENEEQYQLGNADLWDYRSDFFKDNALVLAMIEESSGSIGHEYLGVSSDNEIIIKRIVPECGTCDMAEYHIVVEIPTDKADEQFSVRFV
ncbi:MAG: hypothetical protein IJZ95_08490 [Oscillospiraceae bacterium]|nr:hypothetical protein [Oscillospiraceae bacterium]